MPISDRKTIVSLYHYDPLDRQHGCTLSQQLATQRFYCKNRLTTEIQGAVRWSIIQHEDQLLALQQSQSGAPNTALLATDQQRSVLNARSNNQPHPLAYSPYGHRPTENGLLSLLGFNGERPDPVTGHYHLGNGYRQFSPVLMRFNSPDSWSPFGAGGLNAYAYCDGEPVNRSDPTGHMWGPLKRLLRMVGVMKKKTEPGIVKIGQWELARGNNDLVRPVSNKSPLKNKAGMTESEVKQFRRELDQSVADGQAMDRKLALPSQQFQPGPYGTSSPTPSVGQFDAPSNANPVDPTKTPAGAHVRDRHKPLSGTLGEIKRDPQLELQAKIANARNTAGRSDLKSQLGRIRS